MSYAADCSFVQSAAQAKICDRMKWMEVCWTRVYSLIGHIKIHLASHLLPSHCIASSAKRYCIPETDMVFETNIFLIPIHRALCFWRNYETVSTFEIIWYWLLQNQQNNLIPRLDKTISNWSWPNLLSQSISVIRYFAFQIWCVSKPLLQSSADQYLSIGLLIDRLINLLLFLVPRRRRDWT